MNLHFTDALAERHIHELRHQAARHRSAASGPPRRLAGRGGRAPLTPGRGPRLALRSRVGFTLVEAGLHLLAGSPHTAE
jgi:hypothetical protein